MSCDNEVLFLKGIFCFENEIHLLLAFDEREEKKTSTKNEGDNQLT